MYYRWADFIASVPSEFVRAIIDFPLIAKFAGVAKNFSKSVFWLQNKKIICNIVEKNLSKLDRN